MAAEPWEGCHGLSSDVSLACFSTRTAWFRLKIESCGRTIAVLTGIYAFCAVFGLILWAVGAVCAGGVLVVVFHTGLWQPWRASIFSVLLASVALTVDEDCKGLQAFFRNEPVIFCNLLSYCFFYSLFFLFESDKYLNCDRANENLIVHL